MKVVSNPDEIGKCGCGRSPTGKCVGWHGLTKQAYEAKLIEWKAAQGRDSNQPTDFQKLK